ncbi:hypothetical protein MKX03_036718 [Papaver bracteatum]|nr:hypothetical protein MKX03_036718 [Papaver bracteatum]
MHHQQDDVLFSFFLHRLTSEWAGFWIFMVLYHIFLLVLSLLSTSAVAYTMACAYTKKEINFSEVTSVVPTYFCRVIWHLASVVSVFEESYGYKALLRSKALIEGKIWIASVIFITLQISSMIVLDAFNNLVANGRIGIMGKVSLGVFCFLLLSILIHIGLVVQTIVYFVCKSYHHENIDKSWLAEHLEAYNVGDYDPLMGDKDIQLEQSSEVMYHIFLLVLSLLSTSAVAYTTACAYTTKETSFKKVTSVVPAIWKRLLITFLWAFLIMILYNFFAILYAILVVVLVDEALGHSYGTGFHILFHINIVIYASGLAYIGVIWHLASVVSVLEESYGYKAILKSKALIKGKTSIALVVFIELQISLMVVLSTFEILVTHRRIGGMGKVSLGIFCFLLLSFFIHFALVIQTVVYFVCKAYHHENIDKSCLAEHLEAYNHVPLTEDRDIQLEEYEVMIESPP